MGIHDFNFLEKTQSLSQNFYFHYEGMLLLEGVPIGQAYKG